MYRMTTESDNQVYKSILKHKPALIYNLITCAKSPSHILENPVTIPCGHSFL